MTDFLLALRTTVWRTAGARYNAARRLKRREFMSVLSLALLSSLSVAIAFLQRIYSPQGGTPLDNYLTALQVVLAFSSWLSAWWSTEPDMARKRMLCTKAPKT